MPSGRAGIDMMKRFSVLRWTIETSVDLVDSHCPGAAPAQARIESDRASDAGLYYGIGYGLVWVLLMLNQGSQPGLRIQGLLQLL